MSDADVFISYAREDRARVAPLARLLEEHGWVVWWDPLIESGGAFLDVINDTLPKARCVIGVWSRHAQHSHWVKAEMLWALHNDRLVLVSLDDQVHLPVPFNTVHADSLAHWRGDAGDAVVRKLVRTLERKTGHAQSPASPLAGADVGGLAAAGERTPGDDVRADAAGEDGGGAATARDVDAGLATLARDAWIEGNVLWALGMLSVGLYYFFVAALVVRTSERVLVAASARRRRADARGAALDGLYALGLLLFVAGLALALRYVWLVVGKPDAYFTLAAALLRDAGVSLWGGSACLLAWFWVRARDIDARRIEVATTAAAPLPLPLPWCAGADSLSRYTLALQRIIVFLAFFALDVHLLSALQAAVVHALDTSSSDLAHVFTMLGVMTGLAVVLLLTFYTLIKQQVWLLLEPGGRVGSERPAPWARRVDWFWVQMFVQVALVASAYVLVHGDALRLLLAP